MTDSAANDPRNNAPVVLAGSRVGLLSDSHTKATRTAVAAHMLLDAGADVLLHLGDICAVDVLDALADAVQSYNNSGSSIRVVFGNMDLEASSLRVRARERNIAVDHPVGVYEIAGRLLWTHHGHNSRVEQWAIDSGAAYFCHGHTHEQRDERISATRVINPGALHRAPSYTVVMLDVETDALECLIVPA